MKNEEDEFPIVQLENITFEKSKYKCGKNIWTAESLYEYVESLHLKPFKYPLVCFDLTTSQKWMKDFDYNQLCNECKRVFECSTDYPIILDNYGQIIDGYHRIVKSIIYKKEYIMAYRLPQMPEPDKTTKE